jgi:hypothetical protein
MAEVAGEIYLGLGADGSRQTLLLGRSNRHGLIAGATGTGKTVTLQGIAESFSAAVAQLPARLGAAINNVTARRSGPDLGGGYLLVAGLGHLELGR